MNYKRTPFRFYEKARFLFPIAAKTFGILAGICATIFAFIDIAGGVLNFWLVVWVGSDNTVPLGFDFASSTGGLLSWKELS